MVRTEDSRLRGCVFKSGILSAISKPFCLLLTFFSEKSNQNCFDVKLESKLKPGR